ncbi:hypothetical protein CerSpe_016390 [Prunus speciosa]
MELLLFGNGILGFIDGSFPCPPQFLVTEDGSVDGSVLSDAFTIWTIHDTALMTLITATLSSSAISCVIGCSTSKAMWVNLRERFASVTRASIFQLKIDLHNIKKGSETIDQYLQKIKDVRDQLSAVGFEIPDDDTVILALKGLHSEYNTVKAVIRGRDHGISLKYLRSQLKAEEGTIEESTRNVPIMSAMAAATQDSSSGSGMKFVPYSSMAYGSHNSSFGFQDKGKGKMFYNQHGHSNGSRFYPKNQSYSNPPPQFSNSPPQFRNGARGIFGKPHQPFRNSYGSHSYAPVPICQICHKKGHIAATCHFRSTIPSYSEAEPCPIMSAMAATAAEIVWLQQLLADLSFPLAKVSSPLL